MGASFNESEIVEKFELEGDDIYYELRDVFKEKGVEGLDFEHESENECLWLGMNPCGIGDEETGKEFKEKVQTELRKIFPDLKDEDFSFFCEVIYG